jgi:nicotinate phosphoribosyltransferase
MVDRDGGWDHDVVTIEHDIQPGTPLLDLVMADGRRLRPPEPLAASRRRARDQLAALPARLRNLEDAAEPYGVEIAPALAALAQEVDRMTDAAVPPG